MRAAVFSLIFLTVSCGGAAVDELGSQNDQLQGVDDEGTELTATAAAGGVACQADGSGTVALTGTVETTGSVDSVEIVASVDGADRTTVGTIQPQDFTHQRRLKTAPYSVALTLPPGSHEVVLCFVQSGARGRTPKETCLAPITIEVACAVSCGAPAFFGNVVHNPSLCTGNGPPHIPVHARGDFGDAATLTITGPAGFSLTAPIRRAGNSCNYQYNWNTRGNSGAGEYEFTVAGAGVRVTTTASLSCH